MEKFRSLFRKIVVGIGKVLSVPFYLGLTLLLYVVLSLINIPLIAGGANQTYSDSSWIAYEIATGGDPFNFYSTLNPSFGLWMWILVFHVLSWLLIPVLIGVGANIAIQGWEERREHLKNELKSLVMDMFINEAGLSTDEAEDRADSVVKAIDHRLRSQKHGNKEET